MLNTAFTGLTIEFADVSPDSATLLVVHSAVESSNCVTTLKFTILTFL